MWTPDVYEGAPAPVGWFQIFIWLAILTMTVGNVLALVQTDVKRMLAYSSVAHAGYAAVALPALVPLLVGEPAAPGAAGAVLYYVLAYAVGTVGAFGALSLLSRDGEEPAQAGSNVAPAERAAASASRTSDQGRPGCATRVSQPPTGGSSSPGSTSETGPAPTRRAPSRLTPSFCPAFPTIPSPPLRPARTAVPHVNRHDAPTQRSIAPQRRAGERWIVDGVWTWRAPRAERSPARTSSSARASLPGSPRTPTAIAPSCATRSPSILCSPSAT